MISKSPMSTTMCHMSTVPDMIGAGMTTMMMTTMMTMMMTMMMTAEMMKAAPRRAAGSNSLPEM